MLKCICVQTKILLKIKRKGNSANDATSHFLVPDHQLRNTGLELGRVAENCTQVRKQLL